MSQITYRNADAALVGQLYQILKRGETVESRNGTTKELLMEQFTLGNPCQRYITTPGRRVSLPAQIAETMWLLAGRDDIGWLENYLPRAKDFSDDGQIWRGAYGPRIRRWAGPRDEDAGMDPTDQLAHVVNLLTEDPGTRRAVITIYNPTIDTEPGKDIPCNNWVHFVARDGKLHGHVTIRSNDVFWGWSGINQFEWSALLEIVAGLVGMGVGTLTFSVSSLHLYEHHFDRAEALVAGEELDVRQRAPGFDGYRCTLEDFDIWVDKWFRIEKMIREEPRGSAWMHIQHFPDPMMRSWLFALYAWWNDDITGVFNENSATRELVGTDLYQCLLASPKRKKPVIIGVKLPDETVPEGTNFVEFVAQLHREKHAAYGDSWKKRGEMLGIMANIARKMDRLGVAGGGDTAADTAIDLLVYLIKYRQWLREHAEGGKLTDDPENVTVDLKKLVGAEKQYAGNDQALIAALHHGFGELENTVLPDGVEIFTREHTLSIMIPHAYALALRLWTKEQKAQWKADNDKRIWKGYDA